MGPTSGRRLLLLALVVSLCATAALAILILLFGDFGETEGRILTTTALISAYSLLALPGGILLDQQRLAPLAWANLALAAAGLVLALTLVWGAGDADADPFVKVLVTVTAFAVAATQISATASRTRAGDARSVRTLFLLATGLVLVAASMVAVAFWAELDSVAYFRLLAAVAVANVLLVVLQPVLRRMAAPAERPAHRLRLTLAGGAERDVELRGRDFAEAAASAIREAEREGGEVTRIERLREP